MAIESKWNRIVKQKIDRLNNKIADAAAVTWGGNSAATIGCSGGGEVIAVSQKAKEVCFNLMADVVSREINKLINLLQN